MDNFHLTEDDIPGSSLEGREPSHLTNTELRFWLQCRGIQTSKLKTKAALVAKVVKIKEDNLPLIDPTPNKEYLQRKRTLAGIPDTQLLETTVEKTWEKPTTGWTKKLKNLHDFTDMNIRMYERKSGKKVDRSNSTLHCSLAKKTCEKPEARGYQLFFENYVHEVWVCFKDEQVYFKAKCLRSQKTKAEPHAIWCVLSCTLPYEVFHAYCTCVAGTSGFCNHVFALLHQISHYSKSGMKEIKPDVYKTGMPQKWDKPRVLGIAPAPINSIIQSSLYEARSESTIANDNDRIEKCKAALHAINPLYGFAYMVSPDSDSTEYVKTTLGTHVPVGSVLSYQLALTEDNFEVSLDEASVEQHPCNLSCDITDYPELPI